ncbi:ATP-binding cassette domain-containing protein [Methylobacillus glycogenes]|uniref:ATP-binding cassette domain-containing protein n=1 Tax=Methylobacillus glycogenes TaxID=406 RepID=UPI0034E2AFC4
MSASNTVLNFKRDPALQDETEASVHQSSTASQPVTLTIKNVEKSYQLSGESLQVLSGINLDIRAGEFISIVGASGCGKSTLLKLVAGLDTQYGGDIVYQAHVLKAPIFLAALCFRNTACFPG